MACTPPLLLSLIRQSSARGWLLTCHLLVSPSMPGSLRAVTVDIHLSTSSQAPLKVLPTDVFSPMIVTVFIFSMLDLIFNGRALERALCSL